MTAFFLKCFGRAHSKREDDKARVTRDVTPVGKPAALFTPTSKAREDVTSNLTSTLTELAELGWWEALQASCSAVAEGLSADHASLYLCTGPGVAALACAGPATANLRLGQLHILPSCATANRTYSTISASELSTYSSGNDPIGLALSLADQQGPVPMTFRCTYGRPAFRLEGRQLAPNELAGPGGPRAGTGTGNGGGTPRSTGGAMRVRSSEELLPCDTGCRQYVAVGVPAGKAMAGMLVLSASGPSPSELWQPDVLRSVALLLSPLLRPVQLPVARRALADVAAAGNVNELVRALHAAAADVMAAAARVDCMQTRVALLREDASMAAVFSVSDPGAGGTAPSLCRRRSQEMLLVDAASSGVLHRPAECFMTPQPHEKDKDGAKDGPKDRELRSPLAASHGTTGTSVMLGPESLCCKSVVDRLGCGSTGVLGLDGGTTGGGLAPACRGQSLPLQHTLLAEALAKGAGLCIADCNAYVQDSKVFPRDLMLFRGSTPPQSLALATVCHEGRPLLALYATHNSLLPPALLQGAVQELGQLLKALAPAISEQLQRGPMAAEWRYLHDELLAPGRRTSQVHQSHPHPLPHHHAHAHPQPGSLVLATGSSQGRASLQRSQLQPQGSCQGQGAASLLAGSMWASGAASPSGVLGSPAGGAADMSSAASRRAKSHDCDRYRGMYGSAGGGKPSASPPGRNGTTGYAGRHLAPTAEHHVIAPNELVSAVSAVAATLSSTATSELTAVRPSIDTSDARLAAFVQGGGDGFASPAGTLTGMHMGLMTHGSLMGQNGAATGRTSFSLEAAGSPRGGVRLAPLISTLHDRLKSAQAEQLTSDSRTGTRLQDLESLRILELVGKGGYGSVFRGQYHGAEVAIKVVQDLAALSGDPKAAAAQQAAAAARRRPAPKEGQAGTALHAKHLHDAIELVASVSMSHPNIVQVITYFTDVSLKGRLREQQQQQQQKRQQQQPRHKQQHMMLPAPGVGGAVSDMFDGSDGEDDGEGGEHDSEDSDGGAPPLQLHLVHMTSTVNSCDSDSQDNDSNEAIVLVMEFCDKGCLKEAISEGVFVSYSQQASPSVTTAGEQRKSSQTQQQQHGAEGGHGSNSGPIWPLPTIHKECLYATLLEVALALRHMHSLHVVHCDLKPQNVLLKSSPRDPRGFTAKLSDFGLAKMMAVDDDGQLVIDETIQSGTITHLPPEALQGARQLGPGVDIFAFGICMWQLLCGMVVYKNMDVKQLIRGVVRHGLRPSWPAWVPREYRELAARCWHESPAGRPTASQLVMELEALLERQQAQAHAAVRRAAAAAGPFRRKPQRCATDTAIHHTRPSAHGVPGAGAAAAPVNWGPVAAAAAGFPVLGPRVGRIPRQWSYYQGQPLQLYQPAAVPGHPTAAVAAAGPSRAAAGLGQNAVAAACIAARMQQAAVARNRMLLQHAAQQQQDGAAGGGVQQQQQQQQQAGSGTGSGGAATGTGTGGSVK